MLDPSKPYSRRRLSFNLIIATLLAACSGCDGGGSFSHYSNYDLSKEMDECRTDSHSPGGAIRCDSIAEECQRRKEKTGYRC